MPNCHVCNSGSERRGTKNGFDLWRCGACGLMFVHPIPDSSSIYDKEYFEGAKKGFGYVSYDEDKEPMIPTFNKYLRRIESLLGKKGTLLDVGAATGFFVQLARDAGFDAKGIEISEHAASAGRAKGRPVQTGVLQEVAGVFECITMLDVIEHVPNPRKELEQAAKLLKSGGVLVINTPDKGSLVARILGLKWHHVGPPEHLYYFSRRTMRALLEQTGFEVVTETTIGKSFTLKYIFKVLHKATKLGVFEKLAHVFSKKSLSRLAIPLNLYDNMFLMARRK